MRKKGEAKRLKTLAKKRENFFRPLSKSSFNRRWSFVHGAGRGNRAAHARFHRQERDSWNVFVCIPGEEEKVLCPSAFPIRYISRYVHIFMWENRVRVASCPVRKWKALRAEMCGIHTWASGGGKGEQGRTQKKIWGVLSTTQSIFFLACKDKSVSFGNLLAHVWWESSLRLLPTRFKGCSRFSVYGAGRAEKRAQLS